MKIYGYARVSGPGQDLDLQLEMLTAAGCDQVFAEKASAAKGKSRPQLAKLLASLQSGDMMLVKSLTRAARSTRDALMMLDAVVARGAVFRSIDEPWADMTTPAGEFLATMISAYAELDRKMILQRTGEGRRFAKARGGRMGRKPSLSAPQARFVVDERAKVPPTSFDDLSGLLKVSVSTLKRAVARAETFALLGPAIGIRVFSALPPQRDIEELTHPPSCAIHTSGLGNPRRCTCGRSPDGPLRGG